MVMLINQDARHTALKAGSVHTAILSPPYLGVRNYKAKNQLGQEANHDCMGWVNGYADAQKLIEAALTLLEGPDLGPLWTFETIRGLLAAALETLRKPAAPCGRCFVCNVRAWAREIWRVLRHDGTLWLNIGDSYNGSGGAGGDYGPNGSRAGQPKFAGNKVKTLKAKDLMGIPWHVALALQADGWYLRNAVIWHKPDAMPGSAEDRLGSSYEFVFLLTKSPAYFFDMEAIREPVKASTQKRAKRALISEPNAWTYGGRKAKGYGNATYSGNPTVMNDKANKKDVWKISTSSYKGEHYATYPPALVEPCIKAGTSEHGVCVQCGAPWERVVKRVFVGDEYNTREGKRQRLKNLTTGGTEKVTLGRTQYVKRETVGWLPTCECYRTRNPRKRARQDLQDSWTGRALQTHAPVKPALVYDPFVGSGTTLEVARALGRRGVGGDLSYKYLVEEAKNRLKLTALENWQTGQPAKPIKPAQDEPLPILPLFAGLDL